MNFGPDHDGDDHGDQPRYEDSDHYATGVRQGRGDAFEGNRAGRLDEHGVAGFDQRPRRLESRPPASGVLPC